MPRLFTLTLCAVVLGLSACSTMDRVGTKMDMMEGRVIEQEGVVFEGRLVAARRVGAMIAIQFSGGQMYNIEDAPLQFVPGDIVRIYRTKRGLEARLWKESKDPTLTTGSAQKAPSVSGS